MFTPCFLAWKYDNNCQYEFSNNFNKNEKDHFSIKSQWRNYFYSIAWKFRVGAEKLSWERVNSQIITFDGARNDLTVKFNRFNDF